VRPQGVDGNWHTSRRGLGHGDDAEVVHVSVCGRYRILRVKNYRERAFFQVWVVATDRMIGDEDNLASAKDVARIHADTY
jgi:hypothetical protein